MNPTVALPGSMTWMEIRLSSGSRRQQNPKGLPLHLLNRFSVAAVGTRAPEFLPFSPAVLSALPVWFSWNPLLSYVTAVLLLVVGVRPAIKKAPPQAEWLEKIILC